MKTLLFAYGNYDRQDDGVSWHIIRKVARDLNIDLPFLPSDLTGELTDSLIWHFDLQLTPNDAEYISEFDRVIFLDAHTGAVPEEVSWIKVHPEFQTSPMTHHFTPQSCISLVQVLYHREPEAILITVRGYEFEFSQLLSRQCEENAEIAAQKVIEFLRQNP
ncbi:MAG TPA: hypothetical protein PKD55_02980 [Bellilinea sp.]|nr:hypothetical protein [Bellilinea sp.]